MPTNPQPGERTSAREEQALLLETLFAGLTGYLGLFSSVPGEKKPSGSVELRSLTGTYFDYSEERARALAWAERNAGAGRELHLCPHLLTARRRVKDNAAPVKALWADADETELPEGFPEPTISVQSSPGKRHLYWALRRVLQPEEAEKLSRRLTYTIRADPGGWALASLLRLPGTDNQKYPGEPRVSIISHDETLVYHPREIEQYLDEDGLTPIGEIPVPAVAPGEKGLLTVNDLDRLSPRMRNLIALGNAAAGKPYKTRSEADFAVAIAMFGAGFEEEAIYAVLSDPSNGISARYREKGPHGGAYLSTTIAKARDLAVPAVGMPGTAPSRQRPAPDLGGHHVP